MLDELPPSKRRFSRRWLTAVALLLTILFGVVVARWNSALSPFERRLVGSWQFRNPGDTPGQIRVMALTADRRVRIVSVVERTGQIDGELVAPGEATWFVKDQTLFLERRQAGVSLVDVMFWGKQLYSWDRIPLVSVSDDQFVAEFVNGNRMTFKKARSSLLASPNAQGAAQ